MKTRILGITTAATLGAMFTLTAGDASAAGTALDVQGARGTGMASAATAWIDDASAIYYNPAGIAQGKKVMVEGGVNFIIPSFSFKDPQGNNKVSTSGVVTPFQVYAAGGITDSISVGVGVNTPYGLTVKWPDGWAGRSQITESSLRTFNINPTMAYHAGPFRIGFGVDITRATLELQKDINFGDHYGHADLGDGTWAVGTNFGVQVEAIKQYLNLGAHYRSQETLDFDSAKAHFSGIPTALNGTLHDQPVYGSVTLPDSMALGVSSRPLPGLNVAVDFVWFGWSNFKSIDLHYPTDTTKTLDSSQPKNWHNQTNLHIGAEGTLSDHLQIRGGVLVDPSPSPDNTLTPDVPDSTRVNLALGGSYKMDNGVHVDLGYQFIVLTGKTSTAPQFPGDYGGFVNVIGVTVGWTSAWGTPDPLPPVTDGKPTEPPSSHGPAPAEPPMEVPSPPPMDPPPPADVPPAPATR